MVGIDRRRTDAVSNDRDRERDPEIFNHKMYRSVFSKARRACGGSGGGAHSPDGGRSSHRQAPGAHHVMGQTVPQGDVADLIEAAHHELPQPAIARLGIATFRSRRPLLVNLPG